MNYAHKAQEKSYIHVDENFKLQAYIHITNDLFPLKVVLVFDSFEKKPLSFQNEVNKLLQLSLLKANAQPLLYVGYLFWGYVLMPCSSQIELLHVRF